MGLSIIGVFLILHGFIFALYAGHSANLFELQQGLKWPDNSWILARFISNDKVRTICKTSCLLFALGFILSGIGLLFELEFWKILTLFTAWLSSLAILLFWDGKPSRIPDKGGVGLLINASIIIFLQFYGWLP